MFPVSALLLTGKGKNSVPQNPISAFPSDLGSRCLCYLIPPGNLYSPLCSDAQSGLKIRVLKFLTKEAKYFSGRASEGRSGKI